jgi:hypothetical protein
VVGGRAIAVQFGGCDGKIANCLPIVPGWNYLVRLLSPPPRDSERQVSVSGGATRELKVRRDAPTQWALAMAVLAVVVGAWLRAFS